MNRKKIEKLLLPKKHIDSADMTSDEKQALYEFLGRYGATNSFAYQRLFKEGFDEWELRGVDAIVKDFCSFHELNIDTGKDFYSRLPLTTIPRIKTMFCRELSKLGMKHRNTISRRFDADNWKEYERIGLRQIINQFLSEHCHDTSVQVQK